MRRFSDSRAKAAGVDGERCDERMVDPSRSRALLGLVVRRRRRTAAFDSVRLEPWCALGASTLAVYDPSMNAKTFAGFGGAVFVVGVALYAGRASRRDPEPSRGPLVNELPDAALLAVSEFAPSGNVDASEAPTEDTNLRSASPQAHPHNGCFIRPVGREQADGAWCTWQNRDDSIYECAIRREDCERVRAVYNEMQHGEPPLAWPCVYRVGAICVDLGEGWGMRRCRATRAQCEALRERHGEPSPCVHRSTF